MKQTQSFYDFISSKNQIFKNYYFKSTIQETTHKIVIKVISELIETAKYLPESDTPNPNFIFDIYDLLRCKTKKETSEEVVELLTKMQNTNVTKNGKRF